MKKTTEIVFVVLMCFFSLLSCRREEITIRNCDYEAYIAENGETCLKIFLSADIPDLKKTKMTVKDPSESLVWSVAPEKILIDGNNFIGYDGIAIPKGMVLPFGEWFVELIYGDGRTVSDTFSVVSDGSSDQLK